MRLFLGLVILCSFYCFGEEKEEQDVESLIEKLQEDYSIKIVYKKAPKLSWKFKMFCASIPIAAGAVWWYWGVINPIINDVKAFVGL